MSNVDIDDLAAAVMEGLEEYVELAEDAMKDAVTRRQRQSEKNWLPHHPTARPADTGRAGVRL